MNYVIWEHSSDETLCSLTDVGNLPEAQEIRYGFSKKKGYPNDVYFDMNPDFKRATKLSDALDNLDSTIVASSRLVSFFQDQKLKSVEYLPVTINNQKKQIASSEYCIVNQVGTQDCIDKERSVLDWNTLNPEQISSVDELVIDESKIDPEVKIFRAKHLTTVIFVERALADEIIKQSFTGIEFSEIDMYEAV